MLKCTGLDGLWLSDALSRVPGTELALQGNLDRPCLFPTKNLKAQAENVIDEFEGPALGDMV